MYLDKVEADARLHLKPAAKFLPPDMVPLRVHEDVVKLATDLWSRDKEKLRKAAPYLFMPSECTWIEWPMGQGNMAIAFSGRQRFGIEHAGTGDVQAGNAIFFAQRFEEATPAMCALRVDLRDGGLRYAAVDNLSHADPLIAMGGVAKIEPLILAILALINSPKLVRRDPVDMSRLNKKRKAAGRYTFHNHHVCRLDVDRKTIRVGATDGGDGASRALHFVRAHLRLVGAQYVLVRPHWRGDAQVGIVKPQYEVDRHNSRWKD